MPNWNWGTFALNWLWGAVNGVPIMLICLIPGVNIIMSIVGGMKGYQWLWESNRYPTIKEMVQKQKIWELVGVIIFMIQLFVITSYIILIMILFSQF